MLLKFVEEFYKKHRNKFVSEVDFLEFLVKEVEEKFLRVKTSLEVVDSTDILERMRKKKDEEAALYRLNHKEKLVCDEGIPMDDPTPENPQVTIKEAMEILGGVARWVVDIGIAKKEIHKVGKNGTTVLLDRRSVEAYKNILEDRKNHPVRKTYNNFPKKMYKACYTGDKNNPGKIMEDDVDEEE